MVNNSGPESKENITSENIFDYLQNVISGIINDDEKIKILDFVNSNYSRILKSDQFLNQSVEVIIEILRSDKVCCEFKSETEVFNVVVKYIIENKTVPDDNKRKHFESIIKLIRFPTMTINEFVHCITSAEWILTGDEKSDIFIELCGGRENRYGFSKIRRLYEEVFFEEPKLNSITFYPCNRALDITTDGIPQCRTYFRTNYPIILKNIQLFNAQWKNMYAKVTLKDQYERIITTAEGLVNVGNNLPKITFNEFIQLRTHINYSIEIEYNEKDITEFWCSPLGIQMPLVVKSHGCDESDNVELTFEQYNRMIWGLTAYKC